MIQKTLLLFVWLVPLTCHATEPSVDIETLYRIVQQQQQQLERQQQEIEALRKKIEIADKQPKPKKSRVKISTKKGFTLKDRKTGSSLRLGGRIHMDQAFYHQDVTSLGNGARLRRARVYASGTIGHDWKFKSEIEFGEDSKVGPRNVFLSYRGWKPVKLTVGHFQEPFSLEGMTSSNFITFMERGLPFVFTPDYHIGATLSGHGSRWNAAAGIFGDTLQSQNDSVDAGWGSAARVTFSPLFSQDLFLHLGASMEYRRPNNNHKVRFRTRPESSVTDRRLVDTRTIRNVDFTLKTAAEATAGYGPFSLQGEYIHTWVERRQNSTLGFSGWYAYGSWFLTGERRNYRPGSGNFGRIEPLHRWGAWEFGLRYSALDLTDKDIHGGREHNWTLGVNWYINPYIRFMANYILVDASPNRDGIHEQPRIFQLRGQVDF